MRTAGSGRPKYPWLSVAFEPFLGGTEEVERELVEEELARKDPKALVSFLPIFRLIEPVAFRWDCTLRPLDT